MKKFKNIQRNFILVTVISIALSSCICETCTTSYSLQNKKDISERNGYQSGKLDFGMKTSNLPAPLLSQKQQNNIETWVGNGWGFNWAIAPSDHLLLNFKYAWRTGEDGFTSQDTAYIKEDNFDNGVHTGSYEHKELASLNFNQRNNQHIFEMGIGYYNRFSNLIRYEAFGGIAFANANTKHELNVPVQYENYVFESTEGRKYFQYFAQGNIGLVSNRFEIALMSRLSFFHFLSQEFEQDGFFDSYEMRNGNITFEPAVRAGVGGKTMRVFCQYEYALPLKETDVKWNRHQFLVGVLFRFNDKIKSVNRE